MRSKYEDDELDKLKQQIKELYAINAILSRRVEALEAAIKIKETKHNVTPTPYNFFEPNNA